MKKFDVVTGMLSPERIKAAKESLEKAEKDWDEDEVVEVAGVNRQPPLLRVGVGDRSPLTALLLPFIWCTHRRTSNEAPTVKVIVLSNTDSSFSTSCVHIPPPPASHVRETSLDTTFSIGGTSRPPWEPQKQSMQTIGDMPSVSLLGRRMWDGCWPAPCGMWRERRVFSHGSRGQPDGGNQLPFDQARPLGPRSWVDRMKWGEVSVVSPHPSSRCGCRRTPREMACCASLQN